MTYNIKMQLPDGWTSEQDQYEEVENAVITHLECHLPDKTGKADEAMIDVYVGDMPSDTTAEDEAYANYVDIIGFDDDDTDDEAPISSWKFNNRTAYGFSGECENGSLMLLMCIEVMKGALLICSVVTQSDEELARWSKYLEMNLRITKAQ